MNVKRLSDEKLIELVFKYRGFVTQICNSAQMSRTQFYRRMRDNRDIEIALQDARESIVDYAESKLLELVNAGNCNAIMFLLRTQGKHRGYVEKQEVEQTNKVINILEVPKMEAEEPSIDEIITEDTEH